MNSTCQIAFVHGDQIATFLFDTTKDNNEPFATLQREALKSLQLKEDAEVYFIYEDDDGDVITVSSDADVQEALAVHKDAAAHEDMLLLNVKVKTPAEQKQDVPENEEATSSFNSFLDENFVLEVCACLNDPMVRQVIPEVAANISAGILHRFSAKQLFDIVAGNPILQQKKKLFNGEWPFAQSWTVVYDEWIAKLTQDQLGKVAFQVPIALARLVAKREKLHKALFVKKKPISKLLKIKQFDFGEVDFCGLMEKAAIGQPVGVPASHVGSVCAVCGLSPIEGVRFRCMVCVGFDMCEACESKGSHPAEHATMKFRSTAAGYVGLAHVYGKNKAVKYQFKAMKQEAKLAKKAHKLEKRLAKHEYGDHAKHERRHHGSRKDLSPASYIGPVSFAAAVAGSNPASKTEPPSYKSNDSHAKY